MEEEVCFFPVAERTLTSQDWAEIDARVSDRSDPLFAEQAQEKFQSLRDYVNELDRTACLTGALCIFSGPPTEPRRRGS